MKQDPALQAGKIAIRVRRLQGCIHPTDCGSQHCAHDDQKLLRQPGMKASMGGNGNCYDNAAIETFFETIKAVLIWRRIWQTRWQAETAIFQYTNGFYNPRRPSALGCKKPCAFRTQGDLNDHLERHKHARGPVCMERLLCLCGRDVSDGVEEAAIVISINPFDRFPLWPAARHT